MKRSTKVTQAATNKVIIEEQNKIVCRGRAMKKTRFSSISKTSLFVF